MSINLTILLFGKKNNIYFLSIILAGIVLFFLPNNNILVPSIISFWILAAINLWYALRLKIGIYVLIFLIVIDIILKYYTRNSPSYIECNLFITSMHHNLYFDFKYAITFFALLLYLYFRRFSSIVITASLVYAIISNTIEVLMYNSVSDYIMIFYFYGKAFITNIPDILMFLFIPEIIKKEL